MRILSQSQTVVKPKPNLLLTNESTQSQTIVKPKPNLLLTNENTQSISNRSKTKTKLITY